ncbi:MAG: hypothetical protein P8099_14305 [Gemmatimonadota bacterium]
MIQTREVPRYSLTERNRRWSLARAVMKQEGLDALLVYGDREGTGPAPFAFDTYFTNDRPGATVLFIGDDAPISFVPLPMNISDHFEASLRGEDLWIAPENMRFPRHPDAIAGVLKAHKLEGSTIGIVCGLHRRTCGSRGIPTRSPASSRRTSSRAARSASLARSRTRRSTSCRRFQPPWDSA